MLLSNLIKRCRLRYREAKLSRSFVSRRTPGALEALVSFLLANQRAVPLEREKFREALFSLSSWKLPAESQDELFLSVEDYLFNNIVQTKDIEWSQWLKLSRAAGHYVNVSNPFTCATLKLALNSGNLDGLQREEKEFLLECFRRHYENVLGPLEPEEQEKVLPVLLELGSLDQILEPSTTSIELIRRWAEHRQAHPRALAAFSPEQIYEAPLRGVGSPNGVSVTLYHSTGARIPTRISCAGSTGDAVLNSEVFTSMFAAALSCDSEPTFVLTNGATLSLSPQSQEFTFGKSSPYLYASIGPAGFVEPGRGNPTLEMQPQEALMLIADFLGNIQAETGLVQVTRWNFADAQKLEKRIADALQSKERTVHLKSSSGSIDPGSVIHAIPLLHRDEDDNVVPVEISIPYHVLSPQKVFDLLRNARENYMQELIANGQRREVMARKAFEEQDQLVRDWRALSADEKEEFYRRHPYVTVNQQYDFALGIIRPIPEKQVDLIDYEEHHRPTIRDQAAEYKEKFKALCEKLIQLNKEGGRADSLTFKLLLDSLLRRAPLLIQHEAFQTEYKKWVENVSDLAWSVLEVWAKQRGLSPQTLAGDNIVFNARFDVENQSVIVQPWVMVDLHDFVALIDCKKGLMEILPAGASPSLADTLIPDPKHQIVDLQSMHQQFCHWVEETLHLTDARQRELAAAESGIRAHPNFSTLIHIEQAKHLLLKGLAGKAAQIIDKIRSSDLAPVYFWGAVTYQYLYLEHNPAGLNLAQLQQQERSQQLFAHAVVRVIQSLKGEEVPFGKRGQEYLGQLRARDMDFVEKLTSRKLEDLSLSSLEKESLQMSPEQEEQLRAGISAIASLELLNLAETMCSLSDDLPALGAEEREVERVLKQIVESEYSLSLLRPKCATQIEELPNMVATNERLSFSVQNAGRRG